MTVIILEIYYAMHFSSQAREQMFRERVCLWTSKIYFLTIHVSYSVKNKNSYQYTYFVSNVRYVNSPPAFTYFQDYFSVRPRESVRREGRGIGN